MASTMDIETGDAPPEAAYASPPKRVPHYATRANNVTTSAEEEGREHDGSVSTMTSFGKSLYSRKHQGEWEACRGDFLYCLLYLALVPLIILVGIPLIILASPFLVVYYSCTENPKPLRTLIFGEIPAKGRKAAETTGPVRMTKEDVADQLIRRRSLGIMEYHKDANDEASDDESAVAVDLAWSRPIGGIAEAVPRDFPGRIHWRLASTLQGETTVLSCLVFSEPITGDFSVSSLKEKARDREVSSAELSEEILEEFQLSAADESIEEGAQEPVASEEDVEHASESQATTPELSTAVSSTDPEAIPTIEPRPLHDVTETAVTEPIEAKGALSTEVRPTASAKAAEEPESPKKIITSKSDTKEKKKTLSKKKKSGKPSKRVKFEMDRVLADIHSSQTATNQDVPTRGTPRTNSTESLWLYPLHAMCDNCLKPFSPGHTTVWSPFLHCNHTFHQNCVLADLLDDPKCPLCKLDYIEHKTTNHDRPVEDGSSSEDMVQ
jgi:hypothetical protein